MSLITSSSWRKFDCNRSASYYTGRICKPDQGRSGMRMWLRGRQGRVFLFQAHIPGDDERPLC